MAATRVLLEVPSISCDHCKRAIETAVGALEGVDRVQVDVAGKTATVDFDQGSVSLEAIEAAVAGEGYEVAARHVTGA